MDIRYNVTGSERKALVGVISEILGREAVYEGAPTFAYSLGEYRIDRNGTLRCPDENNDDEINSLLDTLKERGSGYISEDANGVKTEVPPKLIIQVPMTGFTEEAIENLKKIIASKETLIKKALNTDSLPIEVTSDTLSFPWFASNGTVGENDAYAHFAVALCHMAKHQKRITAKEKEIENDKFTMRLFLIRLGFVGPEYKEARSILLKNLTGNSRFKNGQRPNKTVTPEDISAVETLAGVQPETKTEEK